MVEGAFVCDQKMPEVARGREQDGSESPVSSGAPLTLPQVVLAVQGEDVIVGLHSSALVHAGLFLRTGSVLLEVVPPRPVQLVWKNSPRGLSTRS